MEAPELILSNYSGIGVFEPETLVVLHVRIAISGRDRRRLLLRQAAERRTKGGQRDSLIISQPLLQLPTSIWGRAVDNK